MPIRFYEEYPEVRGSLNFEIKKILYTGHSKFQKIDIIETNSFGKILLIDDIIMLTEHDEFVYHEMITHTPLFIHPNPENILVIGGGDGGTVRECCKHSSVKKIDLVDIDELVTQVSLKYLPSIAQKILSEKVNCHFEDGVKYVKSTKICYDIIIIDSTDPISVGEGLFSTDFYKDCNRILAEDGILVAQSESPVWTPKLVQSIAQKLKSVFPLVAFYQAHIPTYPSGHWAFSFATKKFHPLKDFQTERYSEFSVPLKYYNKNTHIGAFALPTFFKQLIDDA